LERAGKTACQSREESVIRHTVVFRLKHPAGSSQETAFLEAAQSLTKIPGVERFEALRQVSPKNEYSFGLSMEFSDQAAYSRYNDHPAHAAFVRDRWLPEVAEFMEIDYIPLP
jgi:quinol monooxygenase YgiN